MGKEEMYVECDAQEQGRSRADEGGKAVWKRGEERLVRRRGQEGLEETAGRA